MAHVLRFWDGTVRQDHVDVIVGEVVEVVVGSGLEVTVQEQQRRKVRHEKGEGEMERSKTHVQTLFYGHFSHACV